MSLFTVSSAVLVGPRAEKAVQITVRLKDGDIEFSMVIPPEAAKVIANGMLKAAKEAESKIITPILEHGTTVGDS